MSPTKAYCLLKDVILAKHGLGHSLDVISQRYLEASPVFWVVGPAVDFDDSDSLNIEPWNRRSTQTQ